MAPTESRTPHIHRHGGIKHPSGRHKRVAGSSSRATLSVERQQPGPVDATLLHPPRSRHEERISGPENSWFLLTHVSTSEYRSPEKRFTPTQDHSLQAWPARFGLDDYTSTGRYTVQTSPTSLDAQGPQADSGGLPPPRSYRRSRARQVYSLDRLVRRPGLFDSPTPTPSPEPAEPTNPYPAGRTDVPEDDSNAYEETSTYYYQSSYTPSSSSYFALAATSTSFPTSILLSTSSLIVSYRPPTTSSSTPPPTTTSMLPITTTIRPTTLSLSSTTTSHISFTSSVAPTTARLSISTTSSQSNMASPSGFVSGDPNASSSGSSSGAHPGTVAACLAVFFGIGLFGVLLILRRRYLMKKERKAREHRAQLEADYLATKESFTNEKEPSVRELATGPSWDSAFAHNIALPSLPPPTTQKHSSRRGSGWMLWNTENPDTMKRGVSRVVEPPTSVRFSDNPIAKRSGNRDSDSGSGHSISEEDAVIQTASRVSTVSVYTTATVAPPASGSAGYKQPSVLQLAMGQSDSFSGKPQGAYVGYQTPRKPVRQDAFKDGVSNSMSRARQPLNVTNKSIGSQMNLPRRPSRSYHIGTTGSLEEDEYMTEREDSRDNRTLYPRSGGDKLSASPPEDRLSAVGSLMLMDYNEDGAIPNASHESPNPMVSTRWSAQQSHGSHYGRSLTSKYTSTVVNPPTPRLTVTSPSGNALGMSQSTSAGPEEEFNFEKLSQMALGRVHPDYRSPTYSIYNMYDGDDERHGAGRIPPLPRRSLIAGRK